MIEPIVLFYRSEPIILQTTPVPALTVRSVRLTIPATDRDVVAWHEAYARSMNRTLRDAYEHVRSDLTFRARPEELERLLMNAHAALCIRDALATDRTLHRLAERYALTSSIYAMYAYALIDLDRASD